MMSLEQYALSLSRIDEPQALIDFTLGVFRDRFQIKLFNFGVYGTLDRFQRFTDLPTGVASVMPEEWGDRYVAQDYFSQDAAFNHLQHGAAPRPWGDFGGGVVLDEAAEFGLTHGVALPLFGAGNVKAGLMLGGDQVLEDPDALPVIEAMAVLFHARFDSIGRLLKMPDLSDLQMDILFWMGQNKSKPVIATILGLKADNVDYHIRQIFQKMGTTSALQTVLQAMMLGLISPDSARTVPTRERSSKKNG